MPSTASSIFLTTFLILLMFNFGYFFISPDSIEFMILGFFTGLLIVILALGVITGVQILGSGLSTQTQKILFGSGFLVNCLFQIDIVGFPIGLGLANNVINAFGTEMMGIGLMIASIISILALISGVMIFTGGE